MRFHRQRAVLIIPSVVTRKAPCQNDFYKTSRIPGSGRCQWLIVGPQTCLAHEAQHRSLAGSRERPVGANLITWQMSLLSGDKDRFQHRIRVSSCLCLQTFLGNLERAAFAFRFGFFNQTLKKLDLVKGITVCEMPTQPRPLSSAFDMNLILWAVSASQQNGTESYQVLYNPCPCIHLKPLQLSVSGQSAPFAVIKSPLTQA